jgi:NADH-quinone oxidoreductase subunit N
MSLLAALSAPFGVLAQTSPSTLPGIPQTNPVQTAATNALVTPDVSWRALLPLIIIGVGALLMLTVTSLVRKKPTHGTYAFVTVVIAMAALVATIPLWARVQGWDHIFWWNLDTSVTGPFSTLGSVCGTAGPQCGAVGIDGFSLGITMLICIAIALGAMLASDYLRREGLDGPELYVLLLLSGGGGIVMAMANDLIVVFLGLETLSIAVYVLAAFHRKKIQSQESGLKYFVLGGFSSAFFLYGIAMVYGATASTNLVNIKNLLAGSIPAPIAAQEVGPFSGSDFHLNSPLLLLGLGLMIVGLGFKVAAVPFHFWSPDVYHGAPTPVTAFMASGVKAAGFAAFVRVFNVGFQAYATDWRPAIAALAALSMVVGSLLAIVQTNVKRTLAYSSVSHAGFILMAMAAVSTEGNQAVLFYLITYTFMVVGSFGVVALVAQKGDNGTTLDDFRGLAESNPMLAFLMTVFLLAQAGVPFTSGFVAKLYTIIASIAAQATWLAIIAMVSSVVAAFLYLRIIVSMYMSGDTEDGTIREPATPKIRIPAMAGIGLALCLFVTLWVGVFPGPLTDFSKAGQPVLVNMGPAPTASPTVPTGLSPSGSGSPSGAPSGASTEAPGAASSGQPAAAAPTPTTAP